MDCEDSLPRQSPVFPWFGIDIGGTLVKLVYFEPLDLTPDEIAYEGETLQNIRHYLTSNRAYGDEGVRDENLELKNVIFRQRLGNIHFIRFPTRLMPNFIDMCVKKNLHTLVLDVFVTGGGAYKFESSIINSMKLRWHKCDELDTLIRGIHFLASHCPCECYYYDNVDSNDLIKKSFSFNDPYPYLLVNTGSGVSVLLVESQTCFRRVTGSSIGGSTFLGLCCLLTDCSTYEEALELAARGNSEKVDKLVRDIYGGDYERFGLRGEIVASSFGHMCEEERRKSASAADLARSALVTVLNNLCSIAYLCATTEGYAGAFGCLRKYVFDNGSPASEDKTTAATLSFIAKDSYFFCFHQSNEDTAERPFFQGFLELLAIRACSDMVNDKKIQSKKKVRSCNVEELIARVQERNCFSLLHQLALQSFHSDLALNSVYCSFRECCSKPWLKWDLDELSKLLLTKLHGQPLVLKTVLPAIESHLTNPTGCALALSFHGPTGVGKNYVARMIVNSLYKAGFGSNYVHYFVASRDFPHSDEYHLSIYRAQIRESVLSKVSKCKHSLFIFDEIDKMPIKLIDVVSSFLDYGEEEHRNQFKHCIFIFLSNTGEKSITNITFNAWKKGIKREAFTLHDFEIAVTNCAYNEEGGLWHADLIKRHLITFFIPFLPLEREHLRKCVLDYLEKRNYTDLLDNQTFISSVLKEIIYVPEKFEVYSGSGCKRIPQKIEYLIVAEERNLYLKSKEDL